MEALPLDIWAEIASWACTDGGATGCALSLVSWVVHTASAVRRYDSVALHGWDSIRLFKRVMDDANAKGRTLCVRHLFLATIPASAGGRMCTVNRFSYEKREARLARDKLKRWGASPDSDDATALVRQILSGVSHTLRTLSAFGLPAILPESFPALKTLALHYLERTAVDQAVVRSASAAAEFALPSVLRIQLVGATASKLSRHFVTRCPKIACLLIDRPQSRLQGARPVGLLRHVTDAEDALPPNLSKILVRLLQYQGWCGNGAMRANKMRQSALKAAVQGTKLEGIVRTVTLRRLGCLLSSAQFRAWLDLVEGKEGLFTLSGECVDLSDSVLPYSSFFGRGVVPSQNRAAVCIDWEADDDADSRYDPDDKGTETESDDEDGGAELEGCESEENVDD